MGFEQTTDGVFAFVDNRRLQIDVEKGTTLKWHAKIKQPTRFVKNMKLVGEYAAATTLFTGAIIAKSAINDLLDGECDTDDPYRKHKRHK